MQLAKTSRPEVYRPTPRPRLFRRLDYREGRRVVWIAAPPGAGKTALLSSYVERRGLAPLWYQLDSADSDIAAFFRVLRVALASLSLGLAEELPELAPEHLADIAAFARSFFRALCSHLPEHFCLVFDNYHDLERGSGVHAVLNVALAELPQTLPILIASRAEPPSDFARLRANRELEVIGWDELRLTENEAAKLLASLRPRAKVDVRELYRRSRGWAAGLVLLAQQVSDDATTGVDVDDAQSVFDYFSVEVFATMSDELRELLMSTALLPSVTANAARELSGNPNAPRLLEELHRRRWFVDRRDQPVARFEYHALFRDFLLSRARERRGPADFGDFARRSAAELERQGDLDAAAKIYQQHEQWTELARLACEHAAALLTQGRGMTVASWLEALPEAVRAASPWPLFWLGVSRLPFDPAGSRLRLETAFERFRAADDAIGSLLACAAILDGYAYEWSRIGPVDRWIAELESLLGRAPERLPPAIEARIMSAAVAVGLRQPWHAVLDAWKPRAMEMLRSGDAAEHRIEAAHFLFFAGFWRGDYQLTALALREVRAVRDWERASPLIKVRLKIFEVVDALVRADHSSAFAAVDDGVAIAEESGVHLGDHSLYGQGVYAALNAGDIDRAADWLARMEKVFDPRRLLDVGHFYHLKSGLALLRSEHADALALGRESVAVIREVGSPYHAVLVELGVAQALIEAGQPAEAAQMLRELRVRCRELRNPYAEFMAAVHVASAMLALGEDAREPLREAFAIGRQHDYASCLPFWIDIRIAKLCAYALANGVEPEFAAGLIRKRKLPPPSLETPGWPWPVRIRTLGRFDVAIDDVALEQTPKTQRKSLELLKALVAFGAQDVEVAEIAGLLWPESAGDAARAALDVTLMRLRRLLQADDAVLMHGGRVSLNPLVCWIDAWAFERLLERGTDRVLVERQADAVYAVYGGAFLDTVPDPWVVPMRDRLARRFVAHVLATGRAFEAAQRFDVAAAHYEAALERNPRAEELYRRLMICHRERGNLAEVARTYESCRAMLNAELGIEPSAATRAIVAELQRR